MSIDKTEVYALGKTWSVLRSNNAQLGTGNYLIASQESLGGTKFNNDNKYFETNDRNQDGYLRSNVK
ncbi:hypothetical protein [Lactococcus garvieae]|uniref:hypothetical protein n=1 Tax=Lactococcus garvieae TaxID=1363 RepID=UPI00116080FB|nr:hypothetical protein [Lactococcus garvieae]